MKWQAVVVCNLSQEDVEFYVIRCGLGEEKLIDREKLIFEASEEEGKEINRLLSGDEKGDVDGASWYLKPVGG